MRELKLSNSDKVALVDDEDYEWVAEYNWQLGGRNEVIRCTSWGSIKYNVLLHRVINDTPLGMCTDHKNRNPPDNRKENLRTCTHNQNNANRAKTTSLKGVKTSSQYIGVCINLRNKKNPWCAQLSSPRHKRHIGIFKTEKEAALAYNNRAIEIHGEFATLNII